jgi:TolB-like protein
LPLKNLSDDSKQEHFVDGMTDILITDLSKISGLFVIASTSMFTYKGKSVKVDQIGRELGVRYVLEGSVQRADKQLRINTQLIDAKTGGHLWAERYDGKMDNIFSLQDKIIQKIVSALSIKLTASEQEQVTHKETDNTEAYDAFLKGRGHHIRWNPDDIRKAVLDYEKAIKLAPNFGTVYAQLANIYLWEAASWLGLPYQEGKVKGLKYLEMAMENPTPHSHKVAANIYLYLSLYDEAISAAEKALALAPKDPAMHAMMANVLKYASRPKEAIDHAKFVMRYDPSQIGWALWHLGEAHFSMGKLEEAVTYLERCRTHAPHILGLYKCLIAAYAHLGRNQEAKKALEDMKKYNKWSNPNLRLYMALQFKFKNPEVEERLASGLLKAGMLGEPSGYYKIMEKNRLNGEEIKGLIDGRTITGYYLHNGEQWWSKVSKDGKNLKYWSKPGGTDFYDSGKGWVEKDLRCVQWVVMFGGVTHCYPIFINPEGSSEKKDEYLSRTILGISSWAPVD